MKKENFIVLISESVVAGLVVVSLAKVSISLLGGMGNIITSVVTNAKEIIVASIHGVGNVITNTIEKSM